MTMCADRECARDHSRSKMEAALLLVRTSFIFLCKILLVDVVCPFVGGWLMYLLVARKRVPKIKTSNNVQLQRDLGVQVIICGISRSGSASLWQAMYILGFPCFHALHLTNPSTAKLFTRAQTSGSHHYWKRLLRNYKSIADYPAAISYKKLMEIYPNAKIILNTRDPDSWYTSFSQTILKMRKNLVLQVVQPCSERCTKLFLHKKLLNDEPENRDLCITNYKLHVEEIKRYVPSHKLYVFELEKKEGWDPLCKFLDVPIPNVPFPFINNRDSFNTDVAKIIVKIHSSVLIVYLGLIFSIFIQIWKWIFSK